MQNAKFSEKLWILINLRGEFEIIPLKRMNYNLGGLYGISDSSDTTGIIYYDFCFDTQELGVFEVDRYSINRKFQISNWAVKDLLPDFQKGGGLQSRRL